MNIRFVEPDTTGQVNIRFVDDSPADATTTPEFPQMPQTSALMSGINAIGTAVDYVGGAPVRNAIYRALEAKEKGLSVTPELVKGFVDQYRKSPSDAPTSADIAEAVGIPDSPIPPGMSAGMGLSGLAVNALDATWKDIAAFVGDVGLDWTNFIPGKLVAKLGLRGAKQGASASAKAMLKTADVATGSKAPTTFGKSMADTYDAARSAIDQTLTGEPIKTWESSKQIAVRLGIPEEQLPAAVKYGKNSLISRFERFEREGPMGKRLLDWWNDGAQKLEAGVTGEVKRFGVPRNMADAGAQMQGAFDKGLDKFWREMDVTYNKVLKSNPGLKISGPQFLTLKNKLMRQYHQFIDLTESPIKQIRSQAKEITDTIGGMDFKNADAEYWRSLHSVLGQIAFKTKYSMAAIPPNIKVFRQMYFDMQNALESAIRTTDNGGETVRQLRRNNAKMSTLFRDEKTLGNVLSSDVATEAKFSGVLNDTRKIKALKRVIDPADMNKIKSSYLENKIIKRGEDDRIMWRGMAARLREQDRKGILNALFEPRELDNIRDYIRLADRFGEDVLSTSGTGGSVQFMQFAKGLGTTIAGEVVGKPIRSLAQTKGATVAEVAPMFRTPTEYVKSPSSRLKALQTISVQNEAETRRQEKKIIGEFYGLDLEKAKYKEIDNIIKKTKRYNELPPGKMKDLLKRDIERMLKPYRIDKKWISPATI